MLLIITEVTKMNNDMRCVGAWDSENRRMVRPLPGGNHWSAELVEKLGIVPGSRISAQPLGKHQSAFPHQTEDTSVNTASIKNLGHDFSGWFSNKAPDFEESLEAAFEGNLQLGSEYQGYYKCFVPSGSHCRSLFGLKVSASDISFFESRFQNKPPQLRVRLSDADRGFDLPVSSLECRTVWQDRGIPGLEKLLPSEGYLHLRVGLARPWEGDPNHCWMQMNGVLF